MKPIPFAWFTYLATPLLVPFLAGELAGAVVMLITFWLFETFARLADLVTPPRRY